MQRKQVIFIADSLDNAHKFQAVLSGLDVSVSAGSSLQFRKLLSEHETCDLVVYEATNDSQQSIVAIEQLLVDDGAGTAVLVIVREDMLSGSDCPFSSIVILLSMGHQPMNVHCVFVSFCGQEMKVRQMTLFLSMA